MIAHQALVSTSLMSDLWSAWLAAATLTARPHSAVAASNPMKLRRRTGPIADSCLATGDLGQRSGLVCTSSDALSILVLDAKHIETRNIGAPISFDELAVLARLYSSRADLVVRPFQMEFRRARYLIVCRFLAAADLVLRVQVAGPSKPHLEALTNTRCRCFFGPWHPDSIVLYTEDTPTRAPTTTRTPHHCQYISVLARRAVVEYSVRTK